MFMIKRKSRFCYEIGDEVFVKCTDNEIRVGTVCERMISAYFPGRDINIQNQDKTTFYYYRIKILPNSPEDEKEILYLKTLNDGCPDPWEKNRQPKKSIFGTYNGTSKSCAIYTSNQISKFRGDLEK